MTYPAKAIEIATARGYDADAHAAALADGSEDAIGRTHPTNWLTETEVAEVWDPAFYTPKCHKCYRHGAAHESVAHPFRSEVFVERQWAHNALTFETSQEARDYGRELLSRWFVPTDSRVVHVETGEVISVP